MAPIGRLVAYGAFTGAALGAVFIATPAQAGTTSTIDIPGAEIHFVAGDGQANHVLVTQLAGPANTYRFDDVLPIVFHDVYPASAGACTYPNPNDTTVIDCDHPATIISVTTGDRDDVIDYRPALSWQLEAGDGHDLVSTGAGPGGPGRYTTGGPGDDTIVSGPGSEYISGGPGTDTVSYVGRWSAVTASVAGGGGSAGETDSYDGIENIVGGGGADSLTGDAGPNMLDGGSATTPCLPYPLRAEILADSGLTPCLSRSGNDILAGGGGADLLFGRGGDDALAGGTGYDTLDGGAGGGDYCYADADGAAKVDCEHPITAHPKT
jgi:Ca2+-binding RTX toxin-like protein